MLARPHVVELFEAGIDAAACRAYLVEHGPGSLAAFDDALARAAAEEE